MAAMASGALPTRDAEARSKPMPMNFKPDLSHLENCTVCANHEAWWHSVCNARLRSKSGSPNLLIDEGVLIEWSGVVLELERPVKRRTTFQGRAAADMAPRTPGTVLHDTHPPKFRAWFEDSKRAFYSESEDGLTFTERADTLLTFAAQLETRVENGETEKFGKMRQFVGRPRPFEQRTFTVSRSHHPDRRMQYLSAFMCEEFGHAPHPEFWHTKHGDPISRSVWTSAPRLITGKRVAIWESTCLGYSSDGLKWRLFDLGHPAAHGPPPLRDAGDTSNVVYWDFASRRHRVVNRWSAAVPQGQFGTRVTNPNWWREVRGVRISSNDQLAMDSFSSRAFTEDVRWCFDKEGKAEHLRRHTYSLQVTPLEAEAVFVGVLNVLEWPRLDNHDGSEALRFDLMKTYLATSRDGVHFDTGWVYAQQQLIPNGRCRKPPGCATRASLENLVGGWQAANASDVFAELCCEFDHAMTMPASELVTHDGKHHLYYEGRTAPHESRYNSKYPSALAVASWKMHRIAGVRHDPNASGACGWVTTKPMNLTGVAGDNDYVHVLVNIEIAEPNGLLVAEVLDGCRSTGGGTMHPHPQFGASSAIPIEDSADAAVLRWTSTTSIGKIIQDGSLPKHLGVVRLRFYLCGSAKLFSFTAVAGAPPAKSAPTSTNTALPIEESDYASKWQWRIAELQASDIVYGVCVPFHLPRVGTCDRRGCLFSTWHLAMAAGEDRGLRACSRKCTAACPRCKAASFSWSEYTCACFVRCDTNALGFAQTVEDTHPELTEGHVLMRPPGSGKNMWSMEGTSVFDYVTTPLGLLNLTSRKNGGLPAFPLEGWRSTADWAASWLRLLRARRQAGLSTPGWGNSAPKGRFNVTKGGDIVIGGYYLGFKRGTGEILV